MREYESMCEKLDSTGLYDTANSILLRAELMAYAEGLNILWDAIELLVSEPFVSTMVSYGTTILSEMLNTVTHDNTREGIKPSHRAALSVGKNDCTISSLNKYPPIFGLSGSFTEDLQNNQIIFNCTDDLTEEQSALFATRLSKYMPCWLGSVGI